MTVVSWMLGPRPGTVTVTVAWRNVPLGEVTWMLACPPKGVAEPYSASSAGVNAKPFADAAAMYAHRRAAAFSGLLAGSVAGFVVVQPFRLATLAKGRGPSASRICLGSATAGATVPAPA